MENLKILESLKRISHDVWNFILQKLIILSTIALTFVSPIKGLLLTMFAFILLDTALAIYATIKLKGLKSYKSGKLFNIVSKSFLYLSTIVLAYSIDLTIFEGSIMSIPLFISKFMTVLWVYQEIKSMDETSMTLGNRSVWVILKEMTKRVKSIKKDINEIAGDETSDQE